MQEDALGYQWIQELHSYLAYVVLAFLFLAVANAVLGLLGNKMFTPQKDFRLSLFTLILCHLQLLIGLLIYFYFPQWIFRHSGIGDGRVKFCSQTTGR